MKQFDKKGEKNKVGAHGEQIALKYVAKLGWQALDVNYLKKWGEIDIVARETAKNNDVIHFIEVKTVSYETKLALQNAVTHRTWRPEENVHFHKIQRLNRAIESWILEHDYAGEWQIDVCAVRIVIKDRYATVKFIPNVILG